MVTESEMLYMRDDYWQGNMHVSIISMEKKHNSTHHPQNDEDELPQMYLHFGAY